MFKNLLIIFFVLFNFSVYGEENLLTLEQKIDRLQREVNDLSKLVFTRDISNINNSNSSESENSMNVAAFDMRIYDLEKDIKILNLNFEELIFQLDELKNLFEELTIKINTSIINESENVTISEVSSVKKNNEDEIVLENSENTLGVLKINSEDLSEKNKEVSQNNLDTEFQNLEPDKQFQLALDLLRSQKFDQAKKYLKTIISNNGDNKFSGSAHYWLGEIYLLKKDYREAALIFAEGYQKYPLSSKAPDSLYKLAEALSKINKTNEACNTFRKFLKEYINHKLTNKANNKITEFECE